MPACSSDMFVSRRNFSGASPSNSRSNSASPPLGSHPEAPSYFSGASSGSILSESSKRPMSCPSASGKLVEGGDESSGGRSNGAEISLVHPGESSRSRVVDRSMGGSVVPRRSVLGRIAEVERQVHRRKSEPGSSRSVRSSSSLPARIISWYVDTALNFLSRGKEALSYAIWTPVIWISAWVCVFWVVLQLPLSLVKWFIRALCTSSYELSRNKRTVLISGGSTIQALHLARNFYKAGARVIVCEIDGLFGLARFSTACARFYSVPCPGASSAAEYVDALRKIVKREKVVYFIPVSRTSDAYYDALAKPHLEIMGCECFVPSAMEVTSLEDPLRLFERSVAQGLSAPSHKVVSSLDDLLALWESGHFASDRRAHRWIVMSAGPSGMTERTKFRLPGTIDDAAQRYLRRRFANSEISDRRRWIVVREADAGTTSYKLVTCTTVKDSKVVANVTCRLDEKRGLVPEQRRDVDLWLETFFRGHTNSRISGHLSFKLSYNEDDDRDLRAISCRVGVSMPYLCLTSVHPRLVWRPCRHFSRQNSVNLVVNEKYKRTASTLSTVVTNDLGRPSNATTCVVDDSATNDRHFVVPTSPVLDKRDALFVYWDPLPYCAYYHLQFPFRRLAGAIRPAQHKPPLAVVE